MKSFVFRSVIIVIIALALFVHSLMNAQTTADSAQRTLRLIPTPQSVLMGRGQFVITRDVRILVENSKDLDHQFAGSQIADEINTELKFKPAATKTLRGKTILIGQPARDKILQKELKAAKLSLPKEIGSEGYLLHVSSSRILIAANTSAGVFYG